MPKPILYTYYRSSCSWRVRTALEWKGIDYEQRAVHLTKQASEQVPGTRPGEQFSTQYDAVNPMHQVPAFVTEDGQVLTQSVAILEYLEEKYPALGSRHPHRALLPDSAHERAAMRALVETVTSGIHPIIGKSVMARVVEGAEDEEAKRQQWALYWIRRGFVALEKMLEKTAGQYCVGDQVTFADLCLVPQVFNAVNRKVDMSEFPTIQRIYADLLELSAFKKAHPFRQADCPEELKI